MPSQVDAEVVQRGEVGEQRLSVFARHETFHPRFGWLKKGFDRAVKEPEIFLQEDAPVRLGVGKNMVRAIRYWCHAFKLLEDDRPTDFGEQLLGNQGWDIYLEDPASLWLLHWKLLESPCTATAWNFTFNQYHQVEFTVDHLFDKLCEYRDTYCSRIVDASLRKDISCLLRMYVEQPAKGIVAEDSLDCPFAELGLIQSAGNSRYYQFRMGHKSNLPAAVVVFACLQYAQQKSNAKSMPIFNLVHDPGSPGVVFKLTESALCDAIEQVSKIHPKVSLEEAAGKLQLFFQEYPFQLADSILDNYYE
jgi:hypothetical protein